MAGNDESKTEIHTAINAVISRALHEFEPELALMWLLGSEPLLGGARPLDVLALQGSAPVLRALDGIVQGAYAGRIQMSSVREISPELRKRIMGYLVSYDAGNDEARELLVDVADALDIDFRNSA